MFGWKYNPAKKRGDIIRYNHVKNYDNGLENFTAVVNLDDKEVSIHIRNASKSCLFVPYSKQNGTKPLRRKKLRNYRCLAENGKWYEQNQAISVGVMDSDKLLSTDGNVKLLEYCGDRTTKCCQQVLYGRRKAGYCIEYVIDSAFIGTNVKKIGTLAFSFPVLSKKLYCSGTRLLKNYIIQKILFQKQTPLFKEEWVKRSTICNFAECLDIIWF